MTDAHHVPPELQNLLMVVVGNKWPTGDETALRAEAAVWRESAETIRGCAQDVAEVRARVDAGLEGRTREAIDGFLDSLAGPGDDAALTLTVRCCEDAADALEALAIEIETLRIEIIGALAVLAVQLMVDLTVFFWAGGPAAAAAEIAAARVLCLAFLRRAVVHALTRVTESVVAQVGFALLAQVIELGQHHRDSVDGGELRVAAINGAVGGAVGFGAGLAGRLLARSVGKETHLTGLGAVGRGAGRLVVQGGFSALTGMAEGAAQDAVFGLSGDWVSGAANGSFNGAWGARHAAMNPKNLGSISPADHLEDLAGRLPRTPAGTGRPPTPGTPSAGPRPAAGDAPPWFTTTYPAEATGLEGHEVWQDDSPPLSHDTHPGAPDPWESFDPGVNPWAEGHPVRGDDARHPDPTALRHPVLVPPGWENPWTDAETAQTDTNAGADAAAPSPSATNTTEPGQHWESENEVASRFDP
ncbi:WXG100-like domain-containing protein [Streptomyces sp. NPDC054775]